MQNLQDLVSAERHIAFALPENAAAGGQFSFTAYSGEAVDGFAVLEDKEGGIHVVEKIAFDVDSLNLERFTANPVVLFAHDPERAIGQAEVTREDGKLSANIELDRIGFSDLVAKKLDAGTLRGMSIRVQPDPSNFTLSEDGTTATFFGAELVELSVVSLPRDPKALRTPDESEADPAEQGMAFCLSLAEIRANQVEQDCLDAVSASVAPQISQLQSQKADLETQLQAKTEELQASQTELEQAQAKLSELEQAKADQEAEALKLREELDKRNVAFKPQADSGKAAPTTFFEAVKRIQKEHELGYNEAHAKACDDYPELKAKLNGRKQ